MVSSSEPTVRPFRSSVAPVTTTVPEASPPTAPSAALLPSRSVPAFTVVMPV